MIDISDKEPVLRKAIAEGSIHLQSATVDQIRNLTIKKGNVQECARVAGIMAAKNTSESLPFCHPIPLENVEVKFSLGDRLVRVQCEVKAHYKTGVEMEALSCVSVALLTIWDMTKYLEKDETGNYPYAKIDGVRVLSKVKSHA